MSNNYRKTLAQAGLVVCLGVASACGADPQPPTTPVAYDQAFAETWRDGKAELASYDLVYPRYGELRTGTAVAITVTEPFLPGPRVKADQAGGDSYEVVKLNLAEDFQTGIYDYNLMTSVFVATQPANGLPAGAATKVSFSAQEWCGMAYQQALFSKPQRGTPGVQVDSHSYFEGEADQRQTLDRPDGALSEDELMLWARGLAGPSLKPGERVEGVAVFRSAAVQRLQHKPAAWDEVTLSRQAESQQVTVPAGEFACEVFTAEVSSDIGGRAYTFYVDADPQSARRVVKVTRDDGYELQLRGAERLPYWQQHGNADEGQLPAIGLQRRGPGQM